MLNDMKLTVEIKNSAPVELTDLTISLNSLADEYKRFLIKTQNTVNTDDVKLYVKEIKSGSIITELTTIAAQTSLFLDQAGTIIQYATYLKELYGFLIGDQEKPKNPIDKQTYQNLSNIVEPVAKDSGSQFNLGAINLNSENITVNININSLSANTAQNKARKAIEQLKEPITGLHSQVLMYLYQARNDASSTTGDKSIIESIYNGPVKTIFINETIKAKVLSDEHNVFKKAYVVDASVETISGTPKLYKISDIHDVLDKD